MHYNITFVQTMFTPAALKLADNPELMSVFLNLLAYKYKNPSICKTPDQYLEFIRTEFYFAYGQNFNVDLFNLVENQVVDEVPENDPCYLLVSVNTDSPTVSEALH